MKIDRFSGQYRFLSNFYPCAVQYEGEWYPTVEHAYQAAKFPPEQRGEFLNLATMRPGEAKRRGRGRGGSDWYNKSLSVMRNLLREKFKEPKLRKLLLETGDAELIEGNNWHDCFYGVCDCTRCGGKGSNHLGKGLMQVREEIRHAQQS